MFNKYDNKNIYICYILMIFFIIYIIIIILYNILCNNSYKWFK